MTHLQTSLLVLATAFGASAALAGNGDMDRLKDGTCADPAAAVVVDGEAVAAGDCTCLGLQDGSCRADDDDVTADATQLQQRTRTRTGDETGQGSAARNRNGGDH